ncbi:unnamed protein product [Alternaria sp. RS040]
MGRLKSARSVTLKLGSISDWIAQITEPQFQFVPTFIPRRSSKETVNMDSANSADRSLGLRRRKRLKVDVACEICRRRKVKCDGGRPACENCSKRPALQGKCIYALNPSGPSTAGSSSIRSAYATSESARGRRSVQPQNFGVSQPPIVLPSDAPPEQPLSPSLPLAPTQDVSDITQQSRGTREPFGNNSNSNFIEQVKAAIDARSPDRAPRPQDLTATPMVDVSLFPSLQETVIDDLADGLDYELPARKQADSLVNAYWSLVHPLFPVLDKPRFIHAYNALFSGTAIDTNERVFESQFQDFYVGSWLQIAYEHEFDNANIFNEAWLDFGVDLIPVEFSGLRLANKSSHDMKEVSTNQQSGYGDLPHQSGLDISEES